MADLKISTTEVLIEATIIAKQEIYYLVTDDNLNSLKQKNLLSDLFVLIASLVWGAYFSAITTLKAIPTDDLTNSQALKVIQPLDTLSTVFFYSGILFTILTIIMFTLSFDQVKKMKKGKLELKTQTERE
jgi:drug/metabolite transporter (DMT)-like permease